MRHFATSAANFSISTLVLQKHHRFKHKRRFSQVHKRCGIFVEPLLLQADKNVALLLK